MFFPFKQSPYQTLAVGRGSLWNKNERGFYRRTGVAHDRLWFHLIDLKWSERKTRENQFRRVISPTENVNPSKKRENGQVSNLIKWWNCPFVYRALEVRRVSKYLWIKQKSRTLLKFWNCRHKFQTWLFHVMLVLLWMAVTYAKIAWLSILARNANQKHMGAISMTGSWKNQLKTILKNTQRNILMMSKALNCYMKLTNSPKL